MENTNHNYGRIGEKCSNGASRVWRLIESSSKSNGKEIEKISIESIPEDRYDEAVDFLCKYYIADEPLCQSRNINNDLVALEDFRREWRETLEEGISVGAFSMGENLSKPELVGLNVLYIGTKAVDAKEMEKKTFNSTKAKELIEMFVRVRDATDIYKKYETDIYLGAIGLCVHPHYRGLGLAKYMLDARTKIGQELGIPVTVTIFTGPLSQMAAERAGFEVLFERRYDQMLDDNGEIMYPVKGSKMIKVMGKKFESK
ncbi:uncharacterized protein [Venturia canescens]|uniref:uncharacterized protein n=1 Tax=Venturia canescens TaxID=32260 RepID=UPI001C9D29CD|nr:uncharacterized protein LOC122411899 [Venturia canescens]